MAKIAYILLCHKDPEAIIQQAERLTAVGDYMAIHFDARASSADFQSIQAALSANPNVCFAEKREKCGWGEWSLVQATLNALQSAVSAFPKATHFYMLSGDCMAIKTAEYAHQFLDLHDKDFVESFDFFESDWIKTGMKEDRLIYRHFFNERKHKKLFDFNHSLQQKLGLQRRLPADMQIQIGSQWCCLRRRTVEAILEFVAARRDVIRFFRTTWIPDETFFQTLVRHLVPETEIETRTLTFLMFSDYGMPVTFYNDHYDMLLGQDFLFARKISPDATELKRRLGRLYAAKGVSFQISDEGRSLYKFLTQRGRIGRRFAPRFWETEGTLGGDRELIILVCKKWHIAKHLAEWVEEHVGVPSLGYLFHEEDTALPDLGGIETSLGKRTRHRRALMRMLFDYYESTKLVICIDPSGLDLLNDFASDRSFTRVLQIDCPFTNEEMIAHAHRSGLIGTRSPQHTLDRLLPTIRNDLLHEAERVRSVEFDEYAEIRATDGEDGTAQILANFLSVPQDAAQAFVDRGQLFTN